MRRHILLPTLGMVIVGVSVFASSTFAQNTSTPTNSLVEKIATKFNLDKADVQAVFDEEHTARHADMQKRQEERLTTLVAEGTLTEAQKTAILSKMKELQAEKTTAMESMKNMTPEERRATMQKERESLEAWAKEQDIDLKTIFGGMGKRGMHHMKFKDGTILQPSGTQ